MTLIPRVAAVAGELETQRSLRLGGAGMKKRDLFVVVADLDAENALKILLTERQESLGIALDFSPFPPPNGDLLRYSGRDSGCYRDAVDLLRPPQKSHRHAIVREKRKRGGTAPLFAELARRISFRSCEDPAFLKLRTTLQRWFPR